MKVILEGYLTDNKKYLIIIVSVCLALRVGFFLLIHPWNLNTREQLNFQNDSALYHQLAITLLDNGKFAENSSAEPNALRTPVYPLYVAGLYSIFDRNPWIIVLSQLLLDTLTCALLYLILSKLLKPKTALFACLFYAVDPFVILYTNILLTEALFVLMLVAGFYFLTLAVRTDISKRVYYHYAAAGLIFGIATLVRPISMYIPLFLALFLSIVYRKRLLDGIKYAIVFAFMFLCIVSIWLIRNHHYYNEYTLSYIPAWDLLALNVAMMEAPKLGQDLPTVSNKLLAEADSIMTKEGRDPNQLNLMQKANYWKMLGLKYVIKDPFSFAYYHFKGLAFVFLNLGTADFARAFQQPLNSMEHYSGFTDRVSAFFKEKSSFEIGVAAVILPFLLISYICLFAGLWTAWKIAPFNFLLLSAIIALYFVVTPGALGLVRFKLPALPFLAVFMGTGLSFLLEKFKLTKSV